jgi:hypothetical protein
LFPLLVTPIVYGFYSNIHLSKVMDSKPLAPTVKLLNQDTVLRPHKYDMSAPLDLIHANHDGCREATHHKVSLMVPKLHTVP